MAEIRFAEGWHAIRGGDRNQAVRSFAQAAVAEPDSSIAEDALYWQAVTLSRLGRTIEARAVLWRFVDRYAASPRVNEIRVMLAWNLIGSGETQEAERLFRGAMTDASASVRRSAQAGLDLLHARSSRGAATP